MHSNETTHFVLYCFFRTKLGTVPIHGQFQQKGGNYVKTKTQNERMHLYSEATRLIKSSSSGTSMLQLISCRCTIDLHTAIERALRKAAETLVTITINHSVYKHN